VLNYKNARIDEIEINGFLSLESVKIKLGKVNVFVGPNASGKSNIVKALRLLSLHAKGEPMTKIGLKEFRDVSFRFDPTRTIEITVKASINEREVIYYLELTGKTYYEKVTLEDKCIMENVGSKDHFLYLDRNGIQRKRGIALAEYFTFEGTSHIICKSPLAMVPDDAMTELKELAKLLAGIEAYSLSVEHIKQTSRIEEPPHLGYHGENLARVLLYLYLEKRNTYTRIEQTLCQLIPEIEYVIPHIVEGSDKVVVKVKERMLEDSTPTESISDGTLRILSLVTALHTGASMVALEEPENCIHPHLLEGLIDLVRKLPAQVVITTHSPILLDYVNPEEVYVVTRNRDGATIVKRLAESEEIETVKKFLMEGGTLGEAWYSGLIGGVPEV